MKNIYDFSILYNILFVFILIQYTSTHVEHVHPKNIELQTTSLESVSHIKRPFEQQLLIHQNTHPGMYKIIFIAELFIIILIFELFQKFRK